MVLTEEELHVIAGLCILAGAFVTVFLSLRLTGKIKNLAIILSAFIVIHVIYHITGALGLDFLADTIFKPLSYSVLIFFGLYYFIIKKRTTRNG